MRTSLCLIALVALTGLAACGGGGDSASSSTDVNTLLKQTFTGSKDIKSGKFDMSVNVDVKGGGSQLQGPIKVKLGGPFQSEGKGKLPKFAISLSFEGAGQSIKGGLTSTGTKAFVDFNGQAYAVSDAVYQQFKTAFEQAATKNGGNNASLASLGIDPQRWLTNAKNEGEEKVGDADAIKISGQVDVNKLLDDVNTALSKASSLGLQGQTALPTKLTDAQKQQVAKAVKSLTVGIWTGKDDHILRRMKIDFSLSDPTGKSAGSATIGFDLSLLDLNKSQSFEEPSNPKPFDQLMQGLGGLGGALGALGGAGSSATAPSTSGSSSGSSSGGSGSSSKNLAEYTKCIEAAGNDLTKAQKCAELLTK